ncbi:MAG: TorF family putative porin [Burkholderiales bacterium]
MFKKTIIAGLVATAFVPALASAADSPHTLTGNIGIYSQYIFRGLMQTNKEAALQGGFDYSHSSGFYAGTWMSNVSWLSDAVAYTGSSLEMDFYGGYKGTIAGDLGFDVGVLQYYYPGNVQPEFFKADTLEVYGALTWKWLSAKYSHSVSKKTFGVDNSDGTYYLDLSANFPVTDKFTLSAHYGVQEFDGTSNACGASTANGTCASYKDWKIGASYSLPKDFTVGVFFTGTDMSAAQKAFYTNPAAAGSRFLGKDTTTVYLSKTF